MSLASIPLTSGGKRSKAFASEVERFGPCKVIILDPAGISTLLEVLDDISKLFTRFNFCRWKNADNALPSSTLQLIISVCNGRCE